MNGNQPGYWIENGVLWHASDSSGNFHSKRKLTEADLTSVQILNQTWARDAKQVWANGYLVKKVFAPAFQALNASFGRDNECIFDSHGRTVKDVNAAAFEVLDDGLLHDDRRDLKNAGYARCEGKIYHYDSADHKTTSLRSADAATFEVLKHGFARDQGKVFFGINVAKANPRTFRHITCHFGEDGKKVFYLTRIVPEADPATFEFLGGQFWARDKRHVYYQDWLIPGPDPATARVVGSFLADASHVFAAATGKVVEGLDGATLQHLGAFYYRDKASVYCEFDNGFVEDADLVTFAYIGPKHPSGGDARDKNWIYRNKNRKCPRAEYQE